MRCAAKKSRCVWLIHGSAVVLTADLGAVTTIDTDSCTRPHIPAWILRADLNWHHRQQTAYAYPFLRRQDISSTEPFVSVSHSIPVSRRSSFLTVSLDFSFLNGSGEPFEDFTCQTPSDKQEAPATMDAYLWREYTWLTAAQYHVGSSVTYSFPMPGTHLLTYVRLGLSHRKCNDTSDYSLGRDYTSATLAMGCTF